MAQSKMAQSFFLSGEWRASGEMISVRNPHTGGEVASVCSASPGDVEAAIAAAVAAFERTRRMPAHARSAVLAHIAGGIRARHAELSRLVAVEAGKPIRAARQELDRCILTYEIAAEEAKRIGGEVVPMDIAPAGEGRFGLVRRFPLGPVSAITPFNFPMNLVAHKVAPALAAGCPIVLRPSSATPLSALALAEVVSGSGWPAGGFSVLPCRTEVAQPLVVDERIKLFTFTGSPAVGWPLKAKAGRKKVTLELGGNAGVIVHEDADLPFAVARSVAGAFGYAGQSCISVQRIYVHRPIWAAFVDRFLAAAAALRVGNPLDEATDVGPLIDEAAAARVEGWVRDAVAGGARVLLGGTRQGNLMAPTVLADVARGMDVCAREVFAPLVTLAPYDAFEEAVREVDAGAYGLQCGVFTRDVGRLWQAYEEIEVGGVIANDVSSYRVDHMPYGGVKRSGFGREGVRYAIEDMTEPKLLVMNMG